MMKQLWNPSNVWPKFSEISFFLLNKCYPQVSRIPLLPALSRITFSWILWRKEIHIYIFCFVTFFILNMCFFFFHFWNAPLKKAQECWSPQEPKGYMFYSESLFSKFEKKSACRQFGFINQSVEDVTETGRCRGERWRGRRKTKAADRNSSQPAEEKLPTVLVCEFREKVDIVISVVPGGLSQGVCVLWQQLSIFLFLSSQDSFCREKSHWLPG